MPRRRILALSSQVAFGHVGLSAAVPVLQLKGHHVTALPTVILSNHPGWPHVAGQQVPVETLAGMIAALDDNGWLAQHDTVLTGYLPSADHVALAVQVIDRLRQLRPDLRVIVDPVLGDHPKGLYIDANAAQAIRANLSCRADILTPNQFELGWLTDHPVTDLDQAEQAAHMLGRHVLVTSAPVASGQTGVLEVSATGAQLFSSAQQISVPNGVGDVFSALIASGCDTTRAFQQLNALIESSLGADHLRIIDSAAYWITMEDV